MTGLNWDTWSVGHCKIPALQRAKLPRYRREGAVEVRPFPAKKRLRVSEAQGLSDEAMKGNPMTTVIPGVDESKSSLRTTEDLTEPGDTRTRLPVRPLDSQQVRSVIRSEMNRRSHQYHEEDSEQIHREEDPSEE